MTESRVLIVGAGVAGLSLARVLQQAGVSVEVVERVAGWQPIGAGLYLPANAVRALGQLGLGALAGQANSIGHQRLLDHRGRVLVDIDLERIWNDVGICIAVTRAELHDALRTATENVSVRLGVSLTHLEDTSAPRVRFSDGSSEGYDLVVGADGIHSTTRTLVMGGPQATYVGQSSWRFIANGFPDIQGWTAMLGRGRTFLTVALGDGVVYCYADLNTSDAAGTDLGDWREYFAEFAEPVPDLLTHAGDAYQAPIEEVVAPALVEGRVVLIGDAAHATSPNMAQGAAMAMEDALVLGETLKAHSSIDGALADFHQRRQPRVEWVQTQAHRRDRTRSLAPMIRNFTLRVAGERIFRSNYAKLRDLP